MTFLSFQQTLTCIFEYVEKNLEVVWKKEGHTSSTQVQYLKFPLVKITVSKIAF